MGKKKMAAPTAEPEAKPAAVENPGQEAVQTAQAGRDAPTPLPQAQTAAEPPVEGEHGVSVESIFPEDVDTIELVAVDADCGLNLREGPGVGFPAVEVLPEGAVLAVQALPCGAVVPGWALVHTGQRAGWVDIRYLRALEPAEPEG
ncbi:SH3 domain-containing protein [uncultured Dysosmobacter sp.]|uniref:SH3 domain-containing protein n=1 Tax=uncultured Dysosmobacter sp. TaxID=2591384 RepID=UPI00263509CB|nr:SH3 domain-containing protein [uncultured Dysosmobacter sp.]